MQIPDEIFLVFLVLKGWQTREKKQTIIPMTVTIEK